MSLVSWHDPHLQIETGTVYTISIYIHLLDLKIAALETTLIQITHG